MPFLIDGYNLLHVTGILGTGLRAGTLERARLALLNFLTLTLDASERARTTIVFDAQSAPPGLPHHLEHEGINVLFADRKTDADSVIEDLIQKHSAPRTLIVVSSDHRIQRAARRRRARPVDSDVWYYDLLEQQREQRETDHHSTSIEKPPLPLSPQAVKRWLVEFDVEGMKTGEETASQPSDHPSSLKGDIHEEKERDWENPFPPGYGEDLLE